jgi:hypothetical protein
VKGILRPISIREISSLELKRCFRKGFQLYVAHVEEPKTTKGPSLEYFTVLQEFEYVFQEIPGFPPKKEIDFSMLAQGQTQGSTLQQRTNKTLTTGPFGNTCEADEVSPEVEAGVVAGLRCLQP